MFRILIALFFLNMPVKLFAQDKILTRDGEEFLAIVQEITPDSIKYAAVSDSINQELKAVQKADVFMITFKNGTKEVFRLPEATIPPKPQLTAEQLYNLGKTDARRHFNAKGAYWSTFGSSLLFPIGGPLLGIGVGTAVSISNPDQGKIGTYHPELSAAGIELRGNPTYVQGFNAGAKQKKLGCAAAGFGTAFGGMLLLVAVVVSSTGL